MTRITSIEQYHSEYKKSVASPELFWEEQANEFTWKRKWNTVLNWDFTTPSVNWFLGAKLNITEKHFQKYIL